MTKKLLCVIICVISAISLLACNSSESSSENTQNLIEDGTDNSEDGYEVVDSINIDTNEMSLIYTGHEIIDGTGENEEPIKELVVYFDYTNKTSVSISAYSGINIKAFQNGVSLINWITDGNESIENIHTEIIDSATINVGFVFELQDINNPVKIRVDNSYFSYEFEDSIETQYQQQEISLK